MKKPNYDALKEVILNKYGSYEEPDFRFVEYAIKNNPYQNLIESLSRHFKTIDQTDINTDVAFFYLLDNRRKQWVLGLSMLGSYAVLLRLTNKNPKVVSNGTKIDDDEVIILRNLEEQSVSILSQSILESPIKLRLFDTLPENVRLYQALFTDADILPWRNK